MYKNYIKRAIDIVLAVFLILVFLIPCIIVAIAIKLDSEGPIFADTPMRVGQYSKAFRMFKFRSMIVNAHHIMRNDPKYAKLFEEFKNNSFKLNNDPRVTKVGKFIRKYSLDEVPQFINVLLGHMSVVGPRPDVPAQKGLYSDADWLKRVSVRPGVTGLAQATLRSSASDAQRCLLDLEYIDKSNFWVDLKIIVRTVRMILKGSC
jgi:lipopolysaccharide/colanic/teichoic acid biosynthesis glycosyltransferase